LLERPLEDSLPEHQLANWLVERTLEESSEHQLEALLPEHQLEDLLPEQPLAKLQLGRASNLSSGRSDQLSMLCRRWGPNQQRGLSFPSTFDRSPLAYHSDSRSQKRRFRS